jgi:hypothetical protein
MTLTVHDPVCRASPLVWGAFQERMMGAIGGALNFVFTPYGNQNIDLSGMIILLVLAPLTAMTATSTVTATEIVVRKVLRQAIQEETISSFYGDRLVMVSTAAVITGGFVYLSRSCYREKKERQVIHALCLFTGIGILEAILHNSYGPSS